MSGSVKRLIILSIVADHVAAAHKQADKTRSRTQIEPIRSIRDRGNFPEHHVLPNKSKMGANGPGWVRRGSHGCNRVYLHGAARKQGEMRQKPAIRTYFSGVITGKKTSRSWQGWSRGSERIQGGNDGRATGSRCDMIEYKQEQSKKTNNVPQKNENEHAQIDATHWFTQQTKQAQNESQKTSRKATTRQKNKQSAE